MEKEWIFDVSFQILVSSIIHNLQALSFELQFVYFSNDNTNGFQITMRLEILYNYTKLNKTGFNKL